MFSGDKNSQTRSIEGSQRPDIPILVFAKCPVPGQVKTRLAASIGADSAAELAAAFLRDSLLQFSRPEGRVWLWGNREDAGDFDGFRPEGVGYQHQGGGDFGERLRRGVEWSRERGDPGVIVVGADTPHLPVEVFEKARACVAAGRVALGPSSDGGYYLLGIPRGWGVLDGLFVGLRWGTSDVLEATRAALESAEGPWQELESFWDVDDFDDLVQLRDALAGRTLEAPETAAILRKGVPGIRSMPSGRGQDRGNPLQSQAGPVDERGSQNPGMSLP